MPPATPTPANAERLLKLRSDVAGVPIEVFSMDNIVCGSHACALGWYVKLNPGCGLELRLRPNGDADSVRPAGRRFQKGTNFVADHFGISRDDEQRLFWHWYELEPAAQKAEFLAKLDALLAAHGIAAPAEGVQS